MNRRSSRQPSTSGGKEARRKKDAYEAGVISEAKFLERLGKSGE